MSACAPSTPPAPRARVSRGGAGSGREPLPPGPPPGPPAAASTRAVVHYQSDSGGRSWTTPASACDALGCLVEAPGRVAVGEEVVVQLEDERVGAPAFLVGRVRSCADAPPWRLSIRFDAVGMLTSLRFF